MKGEYLPRKNHLDTPQKNRQKCKSEDIQKKLRSAILHCASDFLSFNPQHTPTTMIIWKGLGIVVIILFVIGCLITKFVSNSIWGEDYSSTHDWVTGSGFALGSIFCWLVGVSLERRGTRVVIDKATQREITLRSGDSLFFIPVKWWALIGLLVAGFILAFGVPRDRDGVTHKRLPKERTK